MMLDLRQALIPVSTSQAGLALTAANWQEVGVQTLSFHLETLLIKPGYELLKKPIDFWQYLGWPGNSLLNASACSLDAEGRFLLHSPYDGRKMIWDSRQLYDLILQLKPDAVLLPSRLNRFVPEFWEEWPEAIFPFFSLEEDRQNTKSPYGLYAQAHAFDALSRQKGVLRRYVQGSCSLELIKAAAEAGIDRIESDEPANKALQAQVYCQEGLLSLIDSQTALQFAPIDPLCTCPACTQGLTRAYLHHLYAQTPLLAQRFLIQHNIAWVLSGFS